MLCFLFSLIHSELKLSDVNIRIPTYVKEEGGYPYQIVTCFAPDCTFKTNEKDLIEFEIIEHNSTTTLVKILSKSPTPAYTQVIATSGKESCKITVNIDNIYDLRILATADSLYVSIQIPIRVNAYNDKGLLFSSLNGTIIEWGPDIPDRPFDFIDPKNSKLKYYYNDDYLQYNIIQGKIPTTINITCRLVYRKDAKPANQRFRFVDPIVINPYTLYMMPGSEQRVHLYYGEVKDEYVYPNKEREVDLRDDLFSIKSYSPSIATVSNDGIIKALEVGKTTITARDRTLLSNIANMVVEVVIPDEYKYDEQWIKTSDQNDHNKPDFSSLEFFYNKNSVIVPNDLEIVASDEWKSVGTHKIKVELKHPLLEKINKNLTFEATVHTCPPPKAEPNHIYVHDLFNDEIKFNVLGGSGKFNYVYYPVYNKDQSKPVEQEDGKILSLHELSMNYKNKAQIFIVDKLIPDYNTSVVIEIEPKKSDDL